MVKNPPANAGYIGSIPGLGRFQSLCSATGEATAMRSLCTITQEYPNWLQLEKACFEDPVQPSINT